ncbi:MAG: hypothetical protein H6704_21385 [Myxococcales bacterium]|nr:hypothetical protein [Myxococcales bacterium]
MRALSRRARLAALAATVALAPAVGAAQDAEDDEAPLHVREVGALDQQTLDRAEALFFEGLADYRAARFEEAAVKFQQAFLLTRHRDLLFNVARSRERLGDKEGAVTWYRAYLATKPADETAVIHRIRLLGGDPTPKTPVALGGPADEAPKGPEVVEQGAGPWPWVALGVGVAAAGAGAVLGLQALDDASAARQSDVRSEASALKDDAESKALIADVAFGVSAVAVGAAVALWWWADREASSQGAVQVGLGPDAVHLGYGLSF